MDPHERCALGIALTDSALARSRKWLEIKIEALISELLGERYRSVSRPYTRAVRTDSGCRVRRAAATVGETGRA